MDKKYPVVNLRPSEPMLDYYKDRDGNEYSVARVIECAKDLPVFDMPIAGICLDDEIWKGCNMVGLAFNCKKVMDANLKYPVIFDCSGNIADGRHRIIKALILGKATVKAVRIDFQMTPCRTYEGGQ